MIQHETPSRARRVSSHPGEVALLKAEAALDGGDLRAARTLYQEAVDAFGEEDELQSALARVELALVAIELDQLDVAWQALAIACPTLKDAQHPQHALALNQMGGIKRRKQELPEAGALHEAARLAAASGNDLSQQAVAIRNLAELARLQGDLDRAVTLLEESVELQAAEGEPRSVARIWRQIRLIEVEAGRLARAAESARRELELREELGEQAPIAATLVEAARIAALQGRTAEARAWLERAVELRRRLRDPEGVAKALLLGAELLLSGRRPHAARARLRAALEALGEGQGPADIRAELYRALAEADLLLLDAFVHDDEPLSRNAEETAGEASLDEHQLRRRAREQAEAASRLAARTRQAALRATVHRTLARACAHQGAHDEAREQFRASVAAVEELSPGLLDLWAYRTFLDYGTWLSRRASLPTEGPTNLRAGRDYLLRAVTLAERALRQGVTPDLAARARARLAHLHLRAGEAEAAAGELARARGLLGERVEPADAPRALLRRAVEALDRRLADGARGFIDSGVLLETAGAAARDRIQRLAPGEIEKVVYDLHRLQEITKAINSELDLDRLLNLIIDAAVELSAAERGFLILTGATQDEVAFRVARNIERAEVEHPDRKVSNTIARLAIEGGAPVVTGDAVNDERFSGAGSVVEQRLRSVASVPLRAKGRVIGALYLDHRYQDDLFTPRAVELLESLSDHAAIALENARTQHQTRERAASLEGETRQLSSELESRRQEIASIQEALLARSREAGAKLGTILGVSPAIQRVFRLVQKASQHNIPVFIHGESGTGKELVAKAIHYNSARSAGPIVSENFAAISDELLESELFGHVEGAFTGAVADKKGLFERADGGTIFLDEVGDLSMKMQTELLRVLEEKEVRPLGSTEAIPVDVRLISATHRDLRAMVAEGTFRQDLFYRLHVFSIELPPLRDRPEDIPVLAQHFLDEYSAEYCEEPLALSPEALRMLSSFRWPGNVRQLKNFVTRTALLAAGDVIQPEDLSFGTKAETHDAIEDLTLVPWNDAKNAFARRYLKSVLDRVGGNVSQGAREAGMLRQAFQRMLKRHTVDANEYRNK